MDLPTDLIPIPTQPWTERPQQLPLDIEECRTALWVARGNITKAAELLKVPSLRLRRFVKGSPRLSAEIEEAAQQLVDTAEGVVAEALTDGEDPSRRDTMARYVLSSQGKARGWGTASGGSVKINNAAGGTIIVGWADGSDISAPSEKVIDHEG